MVESSSLTRCDANAVRTLLRRPSFVSRGDPKRLDLKTINMKSLSSNTEGVDKTVLNSKAAERLEPSCNLSKLNCDLHLCIYVLHILCEYKPLLKILCVPDL